MCCSYMLVFLVFDSTISKQIEASGENQQESDAKPIGGNRARELFHDVFNAIPNEIDLDNQRQHEENQEDPSKGLAGFALLEDHVAQHEDRRFGKEEHGPKEEVVAEVFHLERNDKFLEPTEGEKGQQ